MKRIVCIVLFVLMAFDMNAERKGPWTKEQAWEWYEKQPWIRGCNYMSADCANRIDQWQRKGFEKRFKTQEQELALAESIGFNTMRIIFAEEGFGVWLADRKGFMRRFERTLQLLDKHHMKAIVLLGNDCSRPKELWKLPKPGKQHYDWGYHGGRKQSQHGSFPGAVGYTCLDDPELAPKFYEFCREVITAHKDDERILFWNLWNEPGNNNRGKLTAVNMPKLFEIAWEIDPIQPLAADVWTNWYHDNLSGDLSDIISFHLYRNMETHKKVVADLRERYGRPMINTEWMARILDCNIEDLYPWFEQQGIGCTMWGFVAGKYQTYEPWESMWKRIEKGEGQEYKMTKWFHDLYRPSLRPYDPKEIEIIRNVNRQADIEFGLVEGKTPRKVISSEYEITSQDSWMGYRRTEFQFCGHKASIVEPGIKAPEGNPWIWSMQDTEEYVGRTGVLELLEAGWHYASIDLEGLGSEREAIALQKKFHDFVSSAIGLSGKAGLIATGQNGAAAVRYACAHPSDISKVYLDSPVLSCGDAGAEDLAEGFSVTGIPMLLIYGGQDSIAVPELNSKAFVSACSARNVAISVIGREFYGHHPYGLDPGRTAGIVDFFKN